MNPFSQFQTDIVRIVNKDKSKTSVDFKVSLSPTKTDIFETIIDVNKGDFIERDLPSGKKELYEITDVTYNKKFGTIDTHYALKLKKIN